MSLSLEVSKTGSSLCIQVIGRIDTSTATQFQEGCQQAIEPETKNLIIDATEVSFLSSMGLRALLSLAKLMKQRSGGVTLQNPPEPVRQVLNMSGFNNFLTITDTGTSS